MQQQWKTRRCLSCGGALCRVHRRFVDRVFSPGRYRFRCKSQECEWIGNLLIDRTSPARLGLFHGCMAASIVLIVAGAVFGLFTIPVDGATSDEVATLNQNPSITQSLVVVDDAREVEKALSASARATTEHSARREH